MRRRHLAIKFAALELYVNTIAFAHRSCIANYRGAVLVPADRVAAAENRERAEALQACGCCAELRIRPMQPPVGARSKLPVRGDEPRADCREPAPDIECLQLEPQRAIGALASNDAGVHGTSKLVREVISATSVEREPRGESRIAWPCFEQAEPRFHPVQPASHCRVDAAGEPIDPRGHIVFPRDHHLRRRRWRGGNREDDEEQESLP